MNKKRMAIPVNKQQGAGIFLEELTELYIKYGLKIPDLYAQVPNKAESECEIRVDSEPDEMMEEELNPGKEEAEVKARGIPKKQKPHVWTYRGNDGTVETDADICAKLFYQAVNNWVKHIEIKSGKDINDEDLKRFAMMMGLLGAHYSLKPLNKLYSVF